MTDDRMETITDPAAIRASDEPDERGDFPCCTTPAPVGAAVALDLDAVEAEFLRQCGGCDAGLMMGCTCSQRDFRPTMLALVAEVRRLTAEAATQREWFEAADAAAERRLDQSIAWMERAEAAEAEVVTLRARLAAVEALAERLAASLALVLYDAHPIYGSTALWHGGIGGQAMTAHCAIIHGGPPGMEWTESDLPSMALREFIAASPGFDLDAAKADMLTDLRAALATGEGK